VEANVADWGVPMSVRSRIDVVRAAGSWLGDELATLTPQQWDLSGACGVWTVGEVVAHLTQWADAYADLIRQALADDVQAMGAPPVLPYAIRSARYAEEAKAYRRELGEGLLSAFTRSQRDLLGQFERVKPNEWDRSAPHPSGVRSVGALLSLRVVELSIHGWEILHRVGRPAMLPDGSHEILVDTLPIRLRGSFARHEPLPRPLRYVFILTSPLQRAIRIVIYGDRVEIDPEEDESSDVVLTLDPLTYVLAFTGRTTWREALDGGAIGVTGRQELAVDLTRWFPPG
jgi:uncharacterized protein (TIGR03083 family)